VLRSVKYGLYAAVLAGVVGGTVAWTSISADRSVHLLVDGRPQTVQTTATTVRQVLDAAGYHPDAHDLIAPRPSSPVPSDGAIVFKRGRLLKLDVNGRQQFVWTTAATVSQALEQLGFSTQDFTSVSRSQRLPLTATDISLRTPRTVTVIHDGARTKVTTTDATVGQLLKDLDLSVRPDDRISANATAPLYSGERIRLTRVAQRTKVTNKVIPFHTKRKIDPSLKAGTKKVVQRGRTGLRSITWSLVYVDGKLVGKVRMQETVLRRPVDQVEHIGTMGEQPSVDTPNAPAAPLPSPGSAQAIARKLLPSYGWTTDQFNCLVQMWDRESGWRVNAANPSGAYGIPQALPGSKMASAGPNWESNASTQIKWGLGYIKARYNSPCQAWSLWQTQGWY
jgi:uncharacterized protein YabE (DUF348 family)